MPEAPSILFLCEQAQQFVGQKVIAVEGRATNYDKERMLHKKIIAIRTFGKETLISFSDFTLRVHLMLFGSCTINSHKIMPPTIGLQFNRGELNYYASNTYLIDEPLEIVYDWRGVLMSEEWDTELALGKLAKIPNTLIADALLDQHIFAGIGNKIKDEALYIAKISPLSKVGSIPEKKLREVIGEAIKYGWKMLEWVRQGNLDDNLTVHFRKECPKHKTTLTIEKLGKTNRKAYFCKKCQKLYA